MRSSLTRAFEDPCEIPASVSQNGQTPFMLAAAKVIIRLTGLNEYAFSSGECPAAPAFQATRHSKKKVLGLLKSKAFLQKRKRALRCLLILKQACSSEYQRAQYAFKDSMIH